MLRTSLTRPASRLRAARGQSRGFAASYAEEEERRGGSGIGTFLVLAGVAGAAYYIYANDLLDDIIVRVYGRGGLGVWGTCVPAGAPEEKTDAAFTHARARLC
jgi:hypothetical protein